MWWIKFRKKYLLPRRWAKKRKEDIRTMKVRSNEEIYKKVKEAKEKLLVAERMGEKLPIELFQKELEILNWLTYADTGS